MRTSIGRIAMQQQYVDGSWLRVDVGLKATSAQLGDVVAEFGVPSREVVARCTGLARWHRTPWDIRNSGPWRTLSATQRSAVKLMGAPFSRLHLYLM
jgi:hypothetical protein